ncbi:MAG TPA: hypothetical protein VL403_18490 [Candidatus Kryptonia bacterium]|nr:hypothetical protein [Candidatus Kryptonia bacterium]
MKRLLASAAVGIGLIVIAATVHTEVAGSKSAPKLVNGAQSIDQLLDQFQHALNAKDESALHRLRVTEDEYRRIIIPGTIKPGEPPREVEQTSSVFFWQMLNQKSVDVGRSLLEHFGGHQTTRKSVKFTKGSRQFGWYTAHGDVRLTLEDEQGRVRELHTGAIAEVDGRFKFIGFNSNS